MKKQYGFTLFELILSLVLTAILSIIVVDLISVPMKSYFWMVNQDTWLASSEIALDTMSRELKEALPQSIKIEKTDNSQSLSFQRILYKNVMTVALDKNRASFVVSENFPNHIVDNNKALFYFPLEKTTIANLYIGKISRGNLQTTIQFDQPLSFLPQRQFYPFYIISTLVRYECDIQKGLLERKGPLNEINNTAITSLLSNNIKTCEFNIVDKSLWLSINIGAKKDKSLPLVTSIYLDTTGAIDEK
jgi:MSHA biogenesis protein MshO